MSAALKRDDSPPAVSVLAYDGMMTADEFSRWPGDGLHWRHALIDGKPVAMNPPSYRHGDIHGRLMRVLGNHLAEHRPGCGAPDCSAAVGVGVQPRAAADVNVRVPDLTVACGEQRRHYAQDPLLIAEILSPSNEKETREAVRACLSIPSLQEVLVLDSLGVAAEVLTRQPDGAWPANPVLLLDDAELALVSLGFRCPLRDLYPA